MLSLQDHYPVPHFIPTLTNDEFRALKPDPGCPTCRGEKTFLWDHDESGPVESPVQWRCDCTDQIILFNYLRRCGLPQPGLWRVAEDLPPFDRGAAELREYADDPKDHALIGLNLAIMGEPHSGKSTWGTYILKKFIAEQWDVQCLSVDTLADAYTATWGRKVRVAAVEHGDEEWRPALARILRVPVLMIDNIGRNKRHDAQTVQQAFTRITSERVDAGYTTIVTYSGEEGPDTPHVSLDHLEATTIIAKTSGPNLTKSNKERMILDRRSTISRPMRLI